MKILGFNHIGINILDFDRSIAFYRDVLNVSVQKTVKMDDCTITYLIFENGERIELFDYYGGNVQQETEDSRVGYRHIAIQVDDVEAWEQHLRAHNVPIVLAATDIVDLGVQVLLFKDPNGVVLEFCKPI